MSEPLFHYFADCLPDNHPLLADQVLHCVDCQCMVHCNNEVMDAWFETGVGVMCLGCFSMRYRSMANGGIWPFDELVVSDGV